MVNCSCNRRAVISSPSPMCSVHFCEWLKNSIFSKLDKYVSEGDKLAVAVSGGKDSTTLLDITNLWGKNKPIAICIDEGISGYRDKSLKFLRNFCEKKDIKLHVFSFKKEFGKTLDSLLKIRDDKNPSLKACTICGTFRRHLLNKYARKLGATKILFAHNLDDELQTLMMNLATGNINQIGIKGELGGIVSDPLFVVRFKPIMGISEKAIATYAALNYPKLPKDECPNLQESVRFRSRVILNKIESKNKGSKKNLMQVYSDKILPSAKKLIRDSGRKIRTCEACGEPSSNMVCKACEIKRQLI